MFTHFYSCRVIMIISIFKCFLRIRLYWGILHVPSHLVLTMVPWGWHQHHIFQWGSWGWMVKRFLEGLGASQDSDSGAQDPPHRPFHPFPATEMWMFRSTFRGRRKHLWAAWVLPLQLLALHNPGSQCYSGARRQSHQSSKGSGGTDTFWGPFFF